MLSVDEVNARIVRSNHGWYISFYSQNPVTFKKELHRRKGEMNRIKILIKGKHLPNCCGLFLWCLSFRVHHIFSKFTHVPFQIYPHIFPNLPTHFSKFTHEKLK